MKTTKIMSKVLCASALMLPLAMPVGTHAQSLRTTPPVVMSVQAQTAATPRDVATLFLFSLRQPPPDVQYLSRALAQRVANGETVYDLLRIQNAPEFSVSDATIDAAGIATLTVTLNAISDSGTPSTFTLVQEDGAWRIDNIVTQQAQPAPRLPSTTVVEFLTAFDQAGSDVNYPKYFSAALTQRIVNGETIAQLLGVQNTTSNFSVSDATLDASGRATLTATINFLNGPMSATFTLVPEYGTWLIDNIVPEQAQPSATPAPAADPSAVVAAFLGAVQQQHINDVDYAPYLSTALEQRLANGEPIETLLGIQNYAFPFTVNAATEDGAGRAIVTAALGSSSQRTFTLVQEAGVWQIDRIVLSETGTPALTLTETVVGFLSAVQQDPANPAINQYFGTGSLNGRFIDGEPVLSLLGIQTVYRDFSVDSVTLESPGNATVVVTLNFEDGSVQRTFKVSQGPLWGIRDIVIDQAQPAPSAQPSATAAPSATAKPSATAAPSATAKPAASAKPSGGASASPAPSTAPSKLPDTGAADTLLGGLLAVGAALAASGGYLLRRRAR